MGDAARGQGQGRRRAGTCESTQVSEWLEADGSTVKRRDTPGYFRHDDRADEGAMVSRKPPTRQVHASRITLTEKQAIIAACERFITDVLKPRFLPEIRPTEWNYPVDILGRWHGNRYASFSAFAPIGRTPSSRSLMRPLRGSTGSRQGCSTLPGSDTPENGGSCSRGSLSKKPFSSLKPRSCCTRHRRRYSL